MGGPALVNAGGSGIPGSSELSAAALVWDLERLTALLLLSFSLSPQGLSWGGCESPVLWCFQCRYWIWLCFVPVPCPNLYVQLNGLTLTLDTASMLWINLFCLDLYRSLEQFKAIYKLEDSGKRDEHVDVRLDGFQLKVPFLSSFSQQCPLPVCGGSNQGIAGVQDEQTKPPPFFCPVLVLVLFSSVGHKTSVWVLLQNSQ